MRILVLWSDDRSPNLGVRALAAGTAALGELVWGQSEVTMQDFGPSSEGFSLGGRTILRDLGRPHGPLRSFLSSFDLVLDTGAGDSFSDIYGLKRLAVMTYVQRAAQALDIPVVQMPQTIGPFRTALSRHWARRTMSKMAAVIARDSASADYAASLGVPVTATSTDIVFALPISPGARKVRDVLLNVSGLLWNPNPHVQHEKYRAHMRDLVTSLRLSGREVSLLAHVVENGTADDDVPALRDLALSVGEDVELIMPTDLQAVRQSVAEAQLVIGSRMHACLNALSVGTPAIPWAYSRKFAPLLNDLGWSHVVDLVTEPDPVASTLSMLGDGSSRLLERDVERLLSRTRERLGEAIVALRKVQVAT